MGVHGLYSFVIREAGLSSCSGLAQLNEPGRQHVIVVDGNALAYHLCTQTKQRCDRADYAALQRAVDNFCSLFDATGMSLHFVFDGHVEASKLACKVHRLYKQAHSLYHDENLDYANEPAANGHSLPRPGVNMSLPRLALHVVRFAVRSHPSRPQYTQVCGEADRIIASIAIQRGALILSNDTDFLLLYTRDQSPEAGGGLLLLRHLEIDFTRKDLDAKKLPALQVYRPLSLGKLTRILRLPSPASGGGGVDCGHCMALVAALCGYDRSSRNHAGSARALIEKALHRPVSDSARRAWYIPKKLSGFFGDSKNVTQVLYSELLQRLETRGASKPPRISSKKDPRKASASGGEPTSVPTARSAFDAISSIQIALSEIKCDESFAKGGSDRSNGSSVFKFKTAVAYVREAYRLSQLSGTDISTSLIALILEKHIVTVSACCEACRNSNSSSIIDSIRRPVNALLRLTGVPEEFLDSTVESLKQLDAAKGATESNILQSLSPYMRPTNCLQEEITAALAYYTVAERAENGASRADVAEGEVDSMNRRQSYLSPELQQVHRTCVWIEPMGPKLLSNAISSFFSNFRVQHVYPALTALTQSNSHFRTEENVFLGESMRERPIVYKLHRKLGELVLTKEFESVDEVISSIKQSGNFFLDTVLLVFPDALRRCINRANLLECNTLDVNALEFSETSVLACVEAAKACFGLPTEMQRRLAATATTGWTLEHVASSFYLLEYSVLHTLYALEVAIFRESDEHKRKSIYQSVVREVNGYLSHLSFANYSASFTT